uniref:peptidylprolyl isomerase n=1 Tax=Trieres chinensis TaxID=1514140 RepID=A0A7S1Z7X8_TRICV|mmetsp:Transcript_19463/g.39428  ORF Transcript_19463/g.39428 Transcript_19463/m.39428 type:complete len:201 (+) Transcript_19463:63-665(+)
MMRSVLILPVICAVLPSIHSLSVQTERTRREILSNSAVSIFPAFALTQHGVPAAIAAELGGYVDGPRGLKYVVTKEGNPEVPKPERAQEVKTSYTLYLGGFPEDGGKQIDSSKGLFGDQPFKFLAGVSQVISGWDLAILDMREGEARRLVVPSNLGYGEKGAGGRIPGGATLYFEVELVEIGKRSKIGPEQEKWLAEHPL